MESFPISEVQTTQIVSNLQVWATIIGSHLTRKPIGSPVLTKCWNLELTLATNFGSHAQMATNFGGQILATKFGFVPDCWVPMSSSTKQWSDNEKLTTVRLSQLTNSPPYLDLTQYFLFQKHMD